MNFHNRLEKLESKAVETNTDPLIIMRIVMVAAADGLPVSLPILGWHVEGLGDVMREENETDEQLQNRATVIAGDFAGPNGVVRVMHITPDDPRVTGVVAKEMKSVPAMSAQEAYLLMLNAGKSI